MPDRRRHRGPHPQDRSLFAPAQIPRLRRALADYSMLLTKRYPQRESLKLVGDRFELAARQRMAVLRAACTDQAIESRAGRAVGQVACRQSTIAVDGFNLLITIEAALGGAAILACRDGCFRDLSSVHGSYRTITETEEAISLILAELRRTSCRECTIYFDRPVSNSARLRTIIERLIQESDIERGSASTSWRVQLHDRPDAALAAFEGIVVTTDSAVLDKNVHWLNLAHRIVTQRLPDAWIVQLY